MQKVLQHQVDYLNVKTCMDAVCLFSNLDCCGNNIIINVSKIKNVVPLPVPNDKIISIINTIKNVLQKECFYNF